MKKHVLIAPFGDDIESVFQIIRTFNIEKMFLIAEKGDLEHAKDFQKTVGRFRIPSQILEVKSYSIAEMFRIVKQISKSGDTDDIIVNVSSGNKLTSCVTLSAAFVNGIKAVGVMGDKLMMFPVMKFSYYKMLSDQKLRLLKQLHEKPNCCASLEELGGQVKMSLPLISYHVNGNQKVEGLEKMGLVELTGKGKKIRIHLSELGRMLMSGYL